MGKPSPRCSHQVVPLPLAKPASRMLAVRSCRLVDESGSYSEAQLAAGAVQLQTTIKHKYGDDLSVLIKVEMGGACVGEGGVQLSVADPATLELGDRHICT